MRKPTPASRRTAASKAAKPKAGAASKKAAPAPKATRAVAKKSSQPAGARTSRTATSKTPTRKAAATAPKRAVAKTTRPAKASPPKAAAKAPAAKPAKTKQRAPAILTGAVSPIFGRRRGRSTLTTNPLAADLLAGAPGAEDTIKARMTAYAAVLQDAMAKQNLDIEGLARRSLLPQEVLEQALQATTSLRQYAHFALADALGLDWESTTKEIVERFPAPAEARLADDAPRPGNTALAISAKALPPLTLAGDEDAPLRITLRKVRGDVVELGMVGKAKVTRSEANRVLRALGLDPKDY